MADTYSLAKDGNKKLSPHFAVREFASKSGAKIYTDTVLVEQKLINKLEEMFSIFDCSKIIVSSGYRTYNHDRDVGGTGRGQHTKGTAADVCFYDKSGKIIPAKIVCCVAQDIGIPGIANISKNYNYVHLDVRSSGTYKGDEIYGTSSVTKDFYNYFGINKNDVDRYKANTEKESTPAVSTVNTKKYFKKYDGESLSIVNALNSIGENSSFAYRKQIAAANNIYAYSGTASQNLCMVRLIKSGILVKP